tara:strand:- start:119 stop:343 length:225 start_codon:yes stop_codon:yes gene_type:complete
MKLTLKKLKQIIKEEMQNVISEEDDTNAMIDNAQKAVEGEANAAFDRIKAAADESGMSAEMLKGLFIQFLQNMD